MIVVLWALGLLLLGALIYLALLDGAYRVQRSVLIAKPCQQVFDQVRDFTTWRQWSPWLLHEPDTRLEFSATPAEQGGSYSWDGKRVGAGRLTHVAFKAPQHIDQRIEFSRPFRAVCSVSWDFEEQPGPTPATRVTWGMVGRMPFPLRFMARGTATMIGKDYELGLALLNGVLDPAADAPQISFDGPCEFAAGRYLTEHWSGSMEAMPAAMEQGFARLQQSAGDGDVEPPAKPLSVYHKVDSRRRQAVIDMAVPVPAAFEAGGAALQTVGGGLYFKVSLTGDYGFLEMTWNAAKAHLRLYKLRYDSRRPALEVYENDPAALTDGERLQTSLYLPLKP